MNPIPFPLHKHHLWLGIPVFTAFMLDISLTLTGQSANYWLRGFQYVNESNPVARWLLTWHPLSFAFAQPFLFGLILLLLCALPLNGAKFLAIYLTMAHTYGAFGWLKDVYRVHFFLRFGFIIVPAALLLLALTLVDDSTRPRRITQRRVSDR